jgi:hypothetical protein
MFDTETSALLRAIHKDVCENISEYETGIRTLVASKLLESAGNGECTIADLTKVGRDALRYAVITRRNEI